MDDAEYSALLSAMQEAIDGDTELVKASASSATAEGNGVVTSITMPVTMPKSYMEDGFTPVQNSQLVNARRKLNEIIHKNPVWDEVLLGLSTTLLGVLLGKLLGMDEPTVAEVAVCAVLGVLSAGSISWHLSKKKYSGAEIKALATSALESLPEANAKDKEDEH